MSLASDLLDLFSATPESAAAAAAAWAAKLAPHLGGAPTEETPAGVMDSGNTEFTISRDAAVVQIFYADTDGAHLGLRLLVEGVHYDRSGTTINYYTPPREGDLHRAYLFG